jgi:hypothetical protein
MSQDRYNCRAVVNVVMNLRVLNNAQKLSSGYTTHGLSSSVHLHGVK